MRSPGRFLLLAPPHPPLPLEERSVVIGRATSCDLTLPSRAASRRHAEVFPVPGGYAVRDLGSTNGTFLNGERIVAERPLTPGDTLVIGEQSIAFSCLESAPAGLPDGDEHTIIVQTSAVTSALRGDLAQIPPIGLLQMLELERKTGVLEIEAPGGKARLWIEEGHPVHAEIGTQAGLEAALEIATLQGGRFVLAAVPSPPERSIDLPMTELVLEASRRVDEALS